VDKTIKVWDLTNGLLIKTMVGHRRSVRALVLAKPTHVKNNSRLYSASHDHTIIVWDAKTYLWFHTFSAHTNGVFTLALSVNEDFLFSGSADMTIKVWDLKTYRCTATLTGHEASISCLLFSKKTSLLLSGSYDGMMKVWAIDRPTEPLQTFQIHDDVVRDLQIHDNFKMTFSTSKDKTMKLWQL
jgi:WD40 repeat protein